MDKWNNNVYIRGKPLMKEAIPLAATTLENTVTFTVPDGERWFVTGVHLKNCTLSSGDLVLYAQLLDPNDVTMGYFVYAHAAIVTGKQTNVHHQEQ